MTSSNQPEKVSEQIGPEHQDKHPGEEHAMETRPVVIRDSYKGADKLKGKVAIITGGDSGIGRAVAVHFAREGAAGVAILYKDEHKDAQETEALVKKEGARCLLFSGDVGNKKTCQEVVTKAVETLGRLDILVNNASVQFYKESILEIDEQQLETTFRTNVFGYFFMAQACLPHMKEGSCIINTASVTAYKGEPMLLDYSATKGAEVAFTRSLSQQLASKNIRVNAVAPGPIWTGLIPSSFPEDSIESWKKSVPMGRAGQPAEVGPSYVFLASQDASYITGQTVHPNGGTVVNA